MTEPNHPVRVRAPLGARLELRLAVQTDPAPGGLGLPVRTAIADGTPLLQKWVPRDRPELFALLDREVRAGVRFAQVFNELPYPRELSRLVAYDVDGEEPFALLEPYRGTPVGLLGLLDTAQRHPFQVGVLRAALHAAVAAIVHGGISGQTMRWDQATGTVQLVDFEHAAKLGEPTPASWPVGTTVDPSVDLRSAALVIREVLMGQTSNGEAIDISTDPVALQDLLGDVLVDHRDPRPDVTELLGRLQADTNAAFINLKLQLEPGLRAFDAARERKWGKYPGTGPVQSPPPPPPPRRWRLGRFRQETKR